MSEEKPDPYDGLGPYGIAVTALERILELDEMGAWDEARAIASEAQTLAIAASVAAMNEPQPAPELAAAMGDRDDYAARLRATDQGWTRLAAELDQLRDRLAVLAASLDADALATEPSKKSQIQADAARRIREALT